MKTDFARPSERYLTRGSRTVISVPHDSGNIMLVSPDQTGLPAGTPLRDTFQVNGLGSASYSRRFRRNNDLVARLSPDDRIIEINPNLAADDEARGRVRVDAVYAAGKAVGDAIAAKAIQEPAPKPIYSDKPAQYQPGDIVVTAGGTDGGGPTVVKVGPRAHLGGLTLIVGGGHAGGWNQDGSPYGEACITMVGRILRLATPEEVKAGRVMGAGEAVLAMAEKDREATGDQSLEAYNERIRTMPFTEFVREHLAVDPIKSYKYVKTARIAARSSDGKVNGLKPTTVAIDEISGPVKAVMLVDGELYTDAGIKRQLGGEPTVTITLDGGAGSGKSVLGTFIRNNLLQHFTALKADWPEMDMRVLIRTALVSGKILPDLSGLNWKPGVWVGGNTYTAPKRPHGYFAALVVEGKQLRTRPRSQLIGMVGRREEELLWMRVVLAATRHDLKWKSEAFEELKKIAVARHDHIEKLSRDCGAAEYDRDHHKGQAEFLAKEVERVTSDHAAVLMRYKMVQAFAVGDVDEIVVPDEDSLIKAVRLMKAWKSRQETGWPAWAWCLSGAISTAIGGMLGYIAWRLL